MLIWVALAGLLVFNAATVLLVLIQLPGTWMMVLATGLFCYWPATQIHWIFPSILILLAMCGELVEFFAAANGARKSGGSRRGAVAALAGGVGGALLGTFLIPVPIVGTLIGACVGAGLGSYLGDRWAGRSSREAARSGRGAAVGRLWGTIAKVAIAVTMWLVTVVAIFCRAA